VVIKCAARASLAGPGEPPNLAPIGSTNGIEIVNSKTILKAFCIATLTIIVFVGLGPATWQPRSGLGWELDHFLGYFVITLMCCLAWPRPLLVATILTAFAVLLEGLQAFMPDRSSYYLAAVYSAGGVLVAALVSQLFIGVWTRFRPNHPVST